MILKVQYKGGNDFKVLEAGQYKVVGECKRCGKCCAETMFKDQKPCPHLYYETVNDVRQAVCELYPQWPVGCNLWPLPRDIEDIPPECGIKLLKKKRK